MRFSLLIFFLLFAMFSEADTLNISKFIVLDNHTLFTSEIPQLDIIGFKDFKDNKKYRKLKRRVLKVYPFALETKVKLDELNSSLDLIKRKRKQRKYTRKVAKIIKDEYTKSLRKLTIKEGGILIKLIYRETGISTYKILKDYRGWFSAVLWQSFAKIYKHDLRTLYDPKNIEEDILIELILTKEYFKK